MSRRPNRSAVLVQRRALPSKPNLPREEQVEREEPDYRSITLLDKWRFVMQAIPDKRLSAGDLRCLVAIADCYNSSKGRAWPSYSYISRGTGLSRSAIARSVSKLHALDIIHKVSGGTGRANTYRPAFREPPAEINSPETGDNSVTLETGTKHETSLTGETTPVSRLTPDPSHACDTIPLTPRSISVGEYRGIPADGGATRAGGALRPVGGAPGDDGFEQFWASYPKREGRTPAKQAYSRLVANGIAPDTLITKARQYAEAKAGVDAKWLKMPANWLKEECWLEDPQPPRSHEPKPSRPAERVVNKQKPVAKSAKPVVEKPALAKPVASGRTDKAHASPKAYGELSPTPPKPLASAEPAISWRITFDATELGLLRGPAIRADAPTPAVGPSLMAMKPTEPPTSQPRIDGEGPAKSVGRRRQPSFADTAMMLRVFVETRGSVNVEGLLQDYFNVEPTSDIPAEALSELLTKIGLDEKGIAAIRAELLDRELLRKRVTLLECAEGRMSIPVDTVFAMSTLYGLKRKEDMQNERLAEMLASKGLDAMSAAAIKKQIWSVLEIFQ